MTYKQSENKYYHYMSRLGLTKFDAGVTAHGLRAEFAENLLLLEGLMPPSLGGTAQQMPKGQREEIMIGAAVKLGHNDLHTSSAYYSSFRKEHTADNLGSKLGRVIVVNVSTDQFAVLYANPIPKPEPDGSYKKLSATVSANTVVCVVLEEPGKPDIQMTAKEFIQANRHLEGRVRAQLEAAGL